MAILLGRYARLLLLLGGVALSISPAYAVVPDTVSSSAYSSCKIGFVNTERILHDSYPAKQAQERLRAFFAQHSEKLKEMERHLETLKSELEKHGSTVPQEQRHDLERRFNEESAEFQKAQRQANEALDAERNEEYQAIIDRANAVIKKIADREHYDIIFQEAVYVSGRIDITDAVIRALSKEAQKTPMMVTAVSNSKSK